MQIDPFAFLSLASIIVAFLSLASIIVQLESALNSLYQPYSHTAKSIRYVV